MLRITRVREGPETITLKLEGRLAADWTDLLESECRRWVARGKLVLLDLSQVTFVDGLGVTLLRSLQTQQVNIVSAPPLIMDLLSNGGSP